MALKSFRKFGHTKTHSALMLILVVCFGAWGVGDYLSNQFGGGAMVINGQEVPLKEVDNVYRNRLATVTQMLGGQPPSDEMKKQLNLPGMVITEVTNRSLLQQAAQKLRLAPSTRELRDELAQTPMFQQGGHFDGARYKQTISQIGLTTAAYERILSQDLGVRLLSGLVTVAGTQAPAQVAALKPLLDGENTTYQLETFTLNPADIAAQIPEGDDKALAAFYEANKQEYAEPEKRSISALILSADSISGTITVPEEQIKQAYDANPTAYAQPEKRRLRHILVADVKDAVALRGQIKSEADFIKLADEKSLDPGTKGKGGDLGEIAAADVVPAFAKVAFSEPVGQVSAPVKSPFGWHLVWVDAITPANPGTLAAAHERIKADLAAQQADDALQSLLRQVDDRAAGGDSLGKIAASTGLPVKRYNLLTAETNTVEPALVQAAFAAEPGSVAGPVTLPDGALAYLEISTVTAAKVPELASIATRAKADMRSAQLQTELQKRGLAVLAASRQNPGAPLATLAAQAGLPGQAGTLATGANTEETPAWLHGALLALYPLPAGGTLDLPLRNDDKQVLVRLVRRDHPAQTPEQQKSAAGTYRKQLQADTEGLTIAALARDSRIVYNAPVLRQVFGAEWNAPAE